MSRIFDNPNNVREAILQLRIASLDALAKLQTYDVSVVDLVTGVPTGVKIHYVRLDSVITDAQAVAGLAQPETATELAAVARLAASRGVAKAIPSYATWSQAEFLSWYNANVSATQINAAANLAQAKVVMLAMSTELKALGQLAIALRDFIWPNLQD